MRPVIFYKDKAIRGVGVPQGILVPRDPVSLSVVASDAFTDTNGTAIASHAATGGGTWTVHPSLSSGIVINGNRAHNANDTSSRIVFHSLVPTTPNYDVSADVVPLSDNNLSRVAVAGRINTSALTLYWAQWRQDTDVLQLFKTVASVSTQLGSNVNRASVVAEAHQLTLSMDGSLIRLLLDDVVAVSVTDTDITTAGRAGIRLQGNATSTTGLHLDNWEVAA